MWGFEDNDYPEATQPTYHNFNIQNYPNEDINDRGDSPIDDGIYDVSNMQGLCQGQKS